MPKHLRPLDLRAPGAIDQLLAFHRSVFGDTRMENDGGTGSDSGQGAAGDAGTGTDTGGQQQGQNGGQQPGQEQGQQAPAWNPNAWDGKIESLPTGAQKIITDLRKADGDERVAKKTLDAILKAVNPDAGEGEKPDPAQLAQQLTQAQQAQRQAAVELAVYKSAGTHQGDPNALLDSRTFLAKVQDLDPTTADFGAKVDEAIKSAVADNPKLKTARVAGSSSADHAGGSGEGGAKPKTLEEAINAKMSR